MNAIDVASREAMAVVVVVTETDVVVDEEDEVVDMIGIEEIDLIAVVNLINSFDLELSLGLSSPVCGDQQDSYLYCC